MLKNGNLASELQLSNNQIIYTLKEISKNAEQNNGMQANEASYQVGYNSFSQFSREYKRLFGFSPSETQVQGG